MTYEELKKSYDDLLRSSEGYWGQLTVCRHAALEMTSDEERLNSDHPYWSETYEAICELQDRLKEESECGRKAAEIAQRLEAENTRLKAEVARLKDLPLEVAKRVLATRDALVAKDIDAAYNEIYWLNDLIESDPYEPWKDMKASVALRARIAVLEAQADCRYAHMDGIVCAKCGWASALLGEGGK